MSEPISSFWSRAEQATRMAALKQATEEEALQLLPDQPSATSGFGGLVRFLHERMEFDVLAFESGLYHVGRAWERMRGGVPARTAARGATFPIWSRRQQVQPLIDYVGERAPAPVDRWSSPASIANSATPLPAID